MRAGPTEWDCCLAGEILCDRECCPPQRCCDSGCCPQDCEGCIKNGELSDDATVDVYPNPACPLDVILFVLSDVIDNGGIRRVNCTQSQEIKPVEVQYDWVITQPDGTAVSGSGEVAFVLADQAGQYSCTFTASVERDCPPEPRTFTAEATGLACAWDRCCGLFPGPRECCEPGQICCDNVCQATDCSLSLDPDMVCPGGSVELQGVATCNPECATMSLTAEVVEPAMQALASVSVSPGSVPCGPFKTPFTVTVNVSADAAPSTFTVRVEGKIIDGGEVACETTSQATVTIDECVDLNFVDAVPDDLEADPGGFLCVNDDDDNDSDVADKDEPGPTVGENDLRPLTISMSGGWTGEGMVTLSCEAGCGRVRFYENANRTNPVTLPLMWDVPTPDLPKTLYVEGFAASSTPRDVELKALFAGEDGPCEDHVKLTVIRVDLDADSDNNGLIEQSDDPIENDSPGKFLAVNDDDDDLDTLQDANDSGPIVGENDLIPIVLDADFVPPDPSTATWTLSWTPASRIQVWETADKSGQMFANGTALAWPISTSQLFVEGLQPGAVTVTLRVQSPEFPDGCEDVARLTVVRIQLFRDEAATLTLDDWPQNPVSGLPRSPKHLFAKEDNIFGRVTTEPGFGNGYFSFVVASQSDTNGISIKLDEITPGVHQNTTASGEVLRLADVTGSGATDTLKVVDEEILTFELNLWPKKQPLLITKDVMVDRAEATGGGINVFYGSATGDRNVLNQRLWGDAKWWQSGDFDAGNTSGTDLLTLRSLIKNAGSNAAASLEGDFMLISTHGAQDGNLYNDSGAVIFDPNGGGSVGISSGNSANCAASVGNGVFRRAG